MKPVKKHGKIIIHDAANVWPHELRVAHILSAAGHTVEFIPSNSYRRSADIYLDGVEYEIKSPIGKGINAVERNLKNALHQSPNVIIDSSRTKFVHDSSIVSFLYDRCRRKPRNLPIKSIIFIDKAEEIVDISNMI